jgi:hypothetical protein
VLVKELQGLGLRVDLINQELPIDAEEVLTTAVEAEAGAMPTITADPSMQPLDVTVGDEADEFGDIDLGDGMTIQDSEEEIKEVA